MKNKSKKPILLSGIQPSGSLMIGNYIGAIRNWVQLQERYDCLFILVDLHAITVPQEPQDLLRRSYEFLALYLACGIDPDKSTIFVQSHVPAHAQLAWILNCFTSMGELNRMTQFKSKAGQQKGNVNVGLFDYPVLMAADILLYKTNLVPVGDDQKQHLELTRDIAQRFNHYYDEIFTIPEPYIPEYGGRIMGLQNPENKMSKSDADSKNYLALLDSPQNIRSKIKRAVTDPGKDIRYDPQKKPGISNLMTIYSSITNESYDKIEQTYAGQGYAKFKEDVAEALVEFLKPIQVSFQSLIQEKERLAGILKKGADEAMERAQEIMKEVNQAVGFIPKR